MKRYRALMIGVAMLGSFLIAGSGVAFAQGASSDAATTPHPAHVHEGTCAKLNPNPQYPLNPVTIRKSSSNSDKTQTPPPVQGVLTAPTTLYSNTEIDVKLDDLLASPHAINVHKSDADIQTYIACGDIGGSIVDDQLVVAIYPQNNSGYFGMAVLTKKDTKTEVTVYLATPTGETGAPATTPAATPAS